MIPIDIRRDATEWLVFYDADCGFCRWSLGLVLRADRRRRTRAVELQSSEAETLLSGMSEDERMSSWHLLAPDGRRWSAGYAAPPLLRLIPGGRVPAKLLGVAPDATDRVYRWVADHRSTFSKLIPERSKRSADRLIAARS